jgi:hypothetical protein
MICVSDSQCPLKENTMASQLSFMKVITSTSSLLPVPGDPLNTLTAWFITLSGTP